ncbi:MAG: hypothetical protein D6807_06160 [Alphaproteobacteria bacterium]|nr:MAG: hypothetical protein D6807_06160 [Alphaproteobacteria bacterium]
MAEVKSTFTQAQLDALTAAIAQGVTQVRFGDQTIVYASLDEMQRLRDRMIRELAARSDGIPRPLARPSVFRRG